MFITLTLHGHQTLCIFNNKELQQEMYKDYFYDSSDSMAFHNTNVCINKLLIDIESKIKEAGKTMGQYGFPSPAKTKTELELRSVRRDG